MTRLLTCWVRKPIRSRVVGGVDAAAFELVADKIVGDRPAPDPDRGGRKDQQRQEDQQADPRQSPGTSANPCGHEQSTCWNNPRLSRALFDTINQTIVSCPHSLTGQKTSLRADRSVSAPMWRCMGNAPWLAWAPLGHLICGEGKRSGRSSGDETVQGTVPASASGCSTVAARPCLTMSSSNICSPSPFPAATPRHKRRP